MTDDKCFSLCTLSGKSVWNTNNYSFSFMYTGTSKMHLESPFTLYIVNNWLWCLCNFSCNFNLSWRLWALLSPTIFAVWSQIIFSSQPFLRTPMSYNSYDVEYDSLTLLFLSLLTCIESNPYIWQGVLEAIRISCAGYPTRKTFYEFVNRFGVLAPEVLEGR